MSLRHGTGHLAEDLSEYAAGRLPDTRTLHWDRHLVACQTCLSDVDVERRLQAVLTSGPSVPPGLRTTLIAMGAARPMTTLPTPAGGTQVPDVPLVPFGTPLPTGYTLPTVLPASPALHRSPLRSAVMATMVAGASAAAAWGLGVTAGATAAATNGVIRPVTTTTAVTTTSRPTRSLTTVGPGAQIGFTRSTATAAYHWTAQVAGLGLGAPDTAQSTP